jgi:hypothetical protein
MVAARRWPSDATAAGDEYLPAPGLACPEPTPGSSRAGRAVSGVVSMELQPVCVDDLIHLPDAAAHTQAVGSAFENASYGLDPVRGSRRLPDAAIAQAVAHEPIERICATRFEREQRGEVSWHLARVVQLETARNQPAMWSGGCRLSQARTPRSRSGATLTNHMTRRDGGAAAY